MIVKIQKPIGTNEEVPQCFVYDKSRKKEFFMDLTDELDKFFGDEFKIFAKGYFKGDIFCITKKLTDQNW